MPHNREPLSLKRIFAIRHEECVMAIILAIWLLVLHYFFVSRFIGQFADYSEQSRRIFLANFHMAGFDPTAYDVFSRWRMEYDMLRHPLLAWMMWPLYVINQLLWKLTGINCAQFICAILLFVCAFYSGIFLFRLLREHVGASMPSSTVLTFFFFSFAYIMVTAIVPDHFCLSLFLLLFSIYTTSSFSPTSHLQQAAIYVIAAGTTLTNGVLVFIADCIFNGRHVLSPKRIAVAYVVPTLLLLSVATYFSQGLTSTTKWMEQETPKTEIVYENLLGESIQFHRRHILGDVLWRRPVIVRYLWWGSYVIETVYILLFAIGIWYGRRERMLWMLMAIFGFTLLMHIVCGFAANEVQIMTAHWAFVIPLSMGYCAKKWHAANIIIVLLTLYLLASNFYLLHRYLTWPLAK